MSVEFYRYFVVISYTNSFYGSFLMLGKSGSMEKEMIHQMFSRSLSKYQVRYGSYIGDGDAKVHKYLVEHPPYDNLLISKLEDTNHFAKRMFARIKKVQQENKHKILSDGKKFFGKNRMTNMHAIRFKIYFAKAIRESKNDLDELYKKSWVIFKHHYSTDKEPMHEWCNPQWCKYLQSQINDRNFVPDPRTKIPRACLDLLKPVFEELCSKTSLARVLGGGSQNANESFHSLLWTMVPKHRFCSSTILRIGLGLSTIIFNDGFESLSDIFSSLFGCVGYFSAKCFKRFDAKKKNFIAKVSKRKRKSTGITMAANDKNCSSDSDSDMSFISQECENNVANITNDLLALDISEDEMETDYEPGGDA